MLRVFCVLRVLLCTFVICASWLAVLVWDAPRPFSHALFCADGAADATVTYNVVCTRAGVCFRCGVQYDPIVRKHVLFKEHKLK